MKKITKALAILVCMSLVLNLQAFTVLAEEDTITVFESNEEANSDTDTEEMTDALSGIEENDAPEIEKTLDETEELPENDILDSENEAYGEEEIAEDLVEEQTAEGNLVDPDEEPDEEYKPEGVLLQENETIKIGNEYYYTSYSASNYATDTMRYECTGTKLKISVNWTDTPRYDEKYGSHGGGCVNVMLYPDGSTSGEQLEVVYYGQEGCTFSRTFDLKNEDDGRYTLIMYPGLSYVCAMATVSIYKQNGKIYVGEGWGGTFEIALERYNALQEEISRIIPLDVLDQYKQSADYLYTYSCIGDISTSQLAYNITSGKIGDYEKARAIYEYIGNKISPDTASYCQSIMIALLASIDIPAIKIDGDASCGWIYFYCNDQWYLCSPYICVCKDNVGCFDANQQMFTISFLNVTPMIHEYPAASGKTKDTQAIKYEAGYLRDEAVAVLDLVNARRAENGKGALRLDRQLSMAAELRAAETSVYYGHMRPNGKSIYTAAGTGIMSGENIAVGQVSAAEVMDAWMNSDGHRANILEDAFTTIGLACYEHNGKKYWVQLFGTQFTSAYDDLENETGEVTVYAIDRYITLLCKDAELTIKEGESASNTIRLRNLGSNSLYSIPKANSLTYKSDDESIAIVSADGVVSGIKRGKATITVSLGENEVSFDVKVKSLNGGDYSIDYVLDSGTNDDRNPTSYDENHTAIKLYPATRPGYTFKGWYTDAKLKNKITQIPKTAKKDYTLYAGWTIVKYKIAYKLGTGTTINPNKLKTTYTIEDSDYTLQNATKLGYAFLGWYTDANYTNQITKISQGSYGALTLYAKWRGARYTVKYHGNGSTSGSESDTQHEYTTSITKLADGTGFYKKGYHVDYWYKNAKCTGTKYAVGSVQNKLSAVEGSTVDLYAHWTPNTYTVTYNANAAGDATLKGKTSNTKHTYDKSAALQKCGFKRTGYVFIGWNTKADWMGIEFPTGAKVQNLTEQQNATVTLYAMWRPIQYKVAFNKGVKEVSGAMDTINVTYGVPMKLPKNKFTREGYQFAHWKTSYGGKKYDFADEDESFAPKLITKDNGTLTLQPVWTYNIKLNPNGGNGAEKTLTFEADVSKTLPANDFTRTGYTFVGWSPFSTMAVAAIRDKGAVKNLPNTTLYAVWKVKSCKFTFNPNTNKGGTGKQTPKTLNSTQSLPSLADLKFANSNEGLVFKGWNTKKDGSGIFCADGEEVRNIIDRMGSAVTLYAQWGNKIPTYYGYGKDDSFIDCGCYVYSMAMLLEDYGIPTSPEDVYACWGGVRVNAEKIETQYKVELDNPVLNGESYDEKYKALKEILNDTYPQGVMLAIKGESTHAVYAYLIDDEIRIHDPYWHQTGYNLKPDNLAYKVYPNISHYTSYYTIVKKND